MSAVSPCQHRGSKALLDRQSEVQRSKQTECVVACSLPEISPGKPDFLFKRHFENHSHPTSCQQTRTLRLSLSAASQVPPDVAGHLLTPVTHVFWFPFLQVPTKWSNTLRRATESEVAKDVTREATRIQDAATAASQAQTRAAQESLNSVVQ